MKICVRYGEEVSCWGASVGRGPLTGLTFLIYNCWFYLSSEAPALLLSVTVQTAAGAPAAGRSVPAWVRLGAMRTTQPTIAIRKYGVSISYEMNGEEGK